MIAEKSDPFCGMMIGRDVLQFHVIPSCDCLLCIDDVFMGDYDEDDILLSNALDTQQQVCMSSSH